MGEMMLDVVKSGAQGSTGKLLRQEPRDRLSLASVAEPVEHEADTRRRAQEVADLAQPVGAAVLIDGDMVNFGERELSLAQAIGDGVGRKSGPMLDAPEPLLLGRRDKHSIAHECRCGIAVKGVEPKDDHCASIVGVSLWAPKAATTAPLKN